MTRKSDADNERVKRRYLVYLSDAKGRDSTSIDAAASAIERFEDYNKGRDFRKFHIEQARAFKDHLASANARTGMPLSASSRRGASGAAAPTTTLATSLT